MASSTRISSFRRATSPMSRCCRSAGINVYDIMRSDKLVLTTAAVKAIEERLGKSAA